jgi:hypothetical protein
VRVLAKKGSQHYSNVKKKLTVNYVINAIRGCMLGSYIFKGEWFKDEYIKECKTWTCMECKTMHG